MICSSICLIVTGSALIASTHPVLARGGTQGSGELREVVCGMQPLGGLLPGAARDQLVPLGDEVAQRAQLVAEPDPAAHASGGLPAQPPIQQRLVHLTPVPQPLGDPAATLLPRHTKKARGIRHCCLPLRPGEELVETVHPRILLPPGSRPRYGRDLRERATGRSGSPGPGPVPPPGAGAAAWGGRCVPVTRWLVGRGPRRSWAIRGAVLRWRSCRSPRGACRTSRPRPP